MWLATEIAAKAVPGQFILLYSQSPARLLPRPISICETDDRLGNIRIVYRVVGEGTNEFSGKTTGDTVEIMGSVGNGFLAPVRNTLNPDTRALLIGGGIGIPPMLGLAKSLSCEVIIVAGYRNSREAFLTKELGDAGKLVIATDDGSLGLHGTVIDAIDQEKIKADVIFACGPRPMLKGVKKLSAAEGIPAYISMEERMACGIGACLGCVCESVNIDGHSGVHNKRICADGPVFDAAEVVL